jgi:hypothetical protein
MPPRRLVRRRPLWERIKSYFDPWDFILWLSEEIETRDIGNKSVGTQVGVALHFVFMIARVYGSSSAGSHSDDIFSDSDSSTSSGWLAYFVSSWNPLAPHLISPY